MVGEEVLLEPASVNNILVELGKLGNWLQAIGVLVIIWIFMQLTSFILNRKRLKALKRVNERLDIIEGKIDKFFTKKRK